MNSLQFLSFTSEQRFLSVCLSSFNISRSCFNFQASLDQAEQEAEALRQAELEKEKEREALQKKAKEKKDKKGRKSPSKTGSPSKTETPPPRKTVKREIQAVKYTGRRAGGQATYFQTYLRKLSISFLRLWTHTRYI